MKKEKRSTIIVCTLCIILVATVLGTLLYFNNNDICYAILILDRDIPVGSNITLHYEVKSGMFAPSIDNVYLDMWVYHLDDVIVPAHGLLHYYIPIHGLNGEEIIKDQIVISTHHLDSGEYIVYTTLCYTTDRGHEKQLEMDFEIY